MVFRKKYFPNGSSPTPMNSLLFFLNADFYWTKILQNSIEKSSFALWFSISITLPPAHINSHAYGCYYGANLCKIASIIRNHQNRKFFIQLFFPYIWEKTDYAFSIYPKNWKKHTKHVVASTRCRIHYVDISFVIIHFFTFHFFLFMFVVLFHLKKIDSLVKYFLCTHA